MSYKKELELALIFYPISFQDEFDFLEHRFLLPGNGCDWTNGELLPSGDFRPLKERVLYFINREIEDVNRWASIYVPHMNFEKFSKEAMDGAYNSMERFTKKNLADCKNVHVNVVVGDPAGEILKAISQYDIDVVVMATHGRKGLEHTIFGSVTEKVIRKAPVPVMVVNPYISHEMKEHFK